MLLGYIVGINYINDKTLMMSGCWNDAIGIQSLLMSSLDLKVDQLEIALDNNSQELTSKENIVKRLNHYARTSWTTDISEFLFTFSGRSGNGLLTSDLNIITEIELKTIFRRFSPKTKIICIFDMDSATSFMRLPFQYPGKNSKQSSCDEKWNNEFVVLTTETAEERSISLSKYGGALTMSLLISLSTLEKYQRRDVIYIHEDLVHNLRSIGSSKTPVFYSSKPITLQTQLFNCF